MDNLERTDHAAVIPRIDLPGGLGIKLCQLLIHHRGLPPRRPLLQPSSEFKLRRNPWDLPAFEDCPHILSGPAYQQGESASFVDVGDCLVSQFLVSSEAEVFIGVDYVYQVMRDSCSFLRCGLGGADVHVAVDLAA